MSSSAAKNSAAAASSGNSNTMYWALSQRPAEPRDIGNKCRECGKTFDKLGEILGLRRGGRIELKYHLKCMTLDKDPRSQPHSSFHSTKSGATVSEEAPTNKFRKMRTESQF